MEDTMQINTNTASFNVWRNYTSNVSSLKDSMSKLSSGSRINDAGDDPSGLAMSERLRTQTRNTSAAADNVENKLNYLQTSDSWMQKMHDMLGRMGELAVMANDDTKSSTDKAVLQKEFAQMQSEIIRVADDAGKFNGIALFDGSAVTQQVGADGGQEFTGVAIDLQSTSGGVIYKDSGVGATEITWGDLLSSNVAVYSEAGIADDVFGATDDLTESNPASTAVSLVNAGIDFLSEQRADVGAEMQRMEQTLDGLRSYEENITATESRIRDVDVASETAEMSKYNILQQVGTAMLAQANSLPQGVLQLLG
jgi:flagellin